MSRHGCGPSTMGDPDGRRPRDVPVVLLESDVADVGETVIGAGLHSQPAPLFPGSQVRWQSSVRIRNGPTAGHKEGDRNQETEMTRRLPQCNETDSIPEFQFKITSARIQIPKEWLVTENLYFPSLASI
jgi:hypothetical protein